MSYRCEKLFNERLKFSSQSLLSRNQTLASVRQNPSLTHSLHSTKLLISKLASDLTLNVSEDSIKSCEFIGCSAVSDAAAGDVVEATEMF